MFFEYKRKVQYRYLNHQNISLWSPEIPFANFVKLRKKYIPWEIKHFFIPFDFKRQEESEGPRAAPIRLFSYCLFSIIYFTVENIFGVVISFYYAGVREKKNKSVLKRFQHLKYIFLILYYKLTFYRCSTEIHLLWVLHKLSPSSLINCFWKFNFFTFMDYLDIIR